jgi:acylphosphatase
LGLEFVFRATPIRTRASVRIGAGTHPAAGAAFIGGCFFLLVCGMLSGAMTGKSARRYVVQGRVQGVGFRWFVQRRATAMGPTGYVRNLDDGGVEALAVGTAAALDRLRDELWRGPVGAVVSAVHESDAPLTAHRSFNITY